MLFVIFYVLGSREIGYCANLIKIIEISILN